MLHASGAFQKAFLSDAESRLLPQIWVRRTESTAQMGDGDGKCMVEDRKKQDINSQRCYLYFVASVPPPRPMLVLCPSPVSHHTSSFPSYKMKETLPRSTFLCWCSTALSLEYCLVYPGLFWPPSEKAATLSCSFFSFPEYQSRSQLMTGFEIFGKPWETNRKMKITV